MEVLAADKDTFGESNLSPLEGERAENLCRDVDGVSCVAVDIEATEPVDVFRMPAKDMDSRLGLRIEPAAEV